MTQNEIKLAALVKLARMIHPDEGASTAGGRRDVMEGAARESASDNLIKSCARTRARFWAATRLAAQAGGHFFATSPASESPRDESPCVRARAGASFGAKLVVWRAHKWQEQRIAPAEIPAVG